MFQVAKSLVGFVLSNQQLDDHGIHVGSPREESGTAQSIRSAGNRSRSVSEIKCESWNSVRATASAIVRFERDP